jgi:hypothetical protein
MRKSEEPNDPAIGLDDVPKLDWIPLRRNGKRIGYGAVYAWATKGRRGVKLRVEVVGPRLCTRESFLREFFQKLTAARAKQLQKA